MALDMDVFGANAFKTERKMQRQYSPEDTTASYNNPLYLHYIDARRQMHFHWDIHFSGAKRRDVGSGWHLCGQEDILLSKEPAGRRNRPPHPPLRLVALMKKYGSSLCPCPPHPVPLADNLPRPPARPPYTLGLLIQGPFRVANEIGLAGLHRAKALCLVSLGETTVALPSEGEGRMGEEEEVRREEEGEERVSGGKGDVGFIVEKENSQQIKTLITVVVKSHSGMFIKRLSPLSPLNPTLLRALNFEGLVNRWRREKIEWGRR
ncbi:unnamed protein product [Pleuronectes platessa]|uniref:Uncharacterized protein n=1 Tax=Pleuronectes platessa TaxID=8262 RepID=A0A9N7V1Z9_PLEPL|nr:unnamed protein product [Pleuronectes platessa]